MTYQQKIYGDNAAIFLESQPCVRAVRTAPLPKPLKKEAEAFIRRNIIPECGRVSPNCLKAHLIKTAKKFKLPDGKVEKIKSLFRAKIGYNGYYLDAGKLKRVNLM